MPFSYFYILMLRYPTTCRNYFSLLGALVSSVKDSEEGALDIEKPEKFIESVVQKLIDHKPTEVSFMCLVILMIFQGNIFVPYGSSAFWPIVSNYNTCP